MYLDKEEIKRRCYYGMIFFSILIVFMSYLTLTNINIKNDKIDKLLSDYNLIVTPTEIDYIIECLVNVISSSINEL